MKIYVLYGMIIFCCFCCSCCSNKSDGESTSYCRSYIDVYKNETPNRQIGLSNVCVLKDICFDGSVSHSVRLIINDSDTTFFAVEIKESELKSLEQYLDSCNIIQVSQVP